MVRDAALHDSPIPYRHYDLMTLASVSPSDPPCNASVDIIISYRSLPVHRQHGHKAFPGQQDLEGDLEGGVLTCLWDSLGSGRTRRTSRVPGLSGGLSVMPLGDAWSSAAHFVSWLTFWALLGHSASLGLWTTSERRTMSSSPRWVTLGAGLGSP